MERLFRRVSGSRTKRTVLVTIETIEMIETIETIELKSQNHQIIKSLNNKN